MDAAEDRRRLVEEKVRNTENRAVEGLSYIRDVVKDVLMHGKGFLPEDIETDKVFGVCVGDLNEPASVDYIITLDGRRLVAVKCSPGALESRERHLLAFARVVDTLQIPLAVVTDGLKARVLDVSQGKLLSEGLESIPDRGQLLKAKETFSSTPYPRERIEREKRILLAFESIQCTQESCE